MTPEELAFEAENLLKNSVLKRAFVDMRETYVRQLENVPIGDKELQHEITISIQILKALKTRLEQYIQTGKVEQYRRQQESFIAKIREKL